MFVEVVVVVVAVGTGVGAFVDGGRGAMEVRTNAVCLLLMEVWVGERCLQCLGVPVVEVESAGVWHQ